MRLTIPRFEQTRWSNHATSDQIREKYEAKIQTSGGCVDPPLRHVAQFSETSGIMVSVRNQELTSEKGKRNCQILNERAKRTSETNTKTKKKRKRNKWKVIEGNEEKDRTKQDRKRERITSRFQFVFNLPTIEGNKVKTKEKKNDQNNRTEYFGSLL